MRPGLLHLVHLACFLAALAAFGRIVNADSQKQSAISGTDHSLDPTHSGLLKEVSAIDNDSPSTEVVKSWALDIWAEDENCTAAPDRSWAGLDAHPQCENNVGYLNFRRLSFNGEMDGVYRLCVYNDNFCGDPLYSTAQFVDCASLNSTWLKSWSIVDAAGACEDVESRKDL